MHRLNPFCFRLSTAAILCGASVCFAGVRSANANPSEDITRAIHASGASNVSDASSSQFLNALTAVMTRARSRELPDYVTAAIHLRSDLSAQITVAALRVAARATHNSQTLTALVDRIIRAAVRANPDAAPAIARAAAEAAPTLRECIVNAAVAAAPQQRIAILQATSSVSGFAGFFRAAGEEGSFGGFGTISPSNLSDNGGDVTSPEQPPVRR